MIATVVLIVIATHSDARTPVINETAQPTMAVCEAMADYINTQAGIKGPWKFHARCEDRK